MEKSYKMQQMFGPYYSVSTLVQTCKNYIN
jgi:hypothetical protein